ncbi:MAG: phytanoyl-CoA dioxygenase family protein [Alphaproteobacteria bacterium]
MTKIDITDHQVETFQRDGVVALRGVFSQDWIELLRKGVSEAMASPSKVAKNYAEPGKGKFFTDHFMYRRIEPFREFLFNSPAAPITARLMGATHVNLADEHLLVKEPGTENPTYWHQDFPYFEMAGNQFSSLWIPLDPATEENGTLKFVKGSQRWGKMYRPIRIGLGDIVEEADELDGPAPDIDAEPEKYDIETIELDPGDCVAFHAAILHAATPNLSATMRRRALAVRFAGDDITWQPRAYIPSVPDTPDLVEGGPIDSEIYPRIWTAAQ